MKQSELIKQITDEELRKSVIYSQVLFLIIACILSLFLFNDFSEWTGLIQFEAKEVVYYGLIPGIVIVLIDLLMMFFLPNRFYDDGGINKRIFSNLRVDQIFFITLLIAISEEVLFRGVFQTTFGYFIASLFFALVHIRYLAKPVLLVSILFVSFYLGYMYELTGNLLVTITAHFAVDFLLGVLIRYKGWGEV